MLKQILQTCTLILAAGIVSYAGLSAQPVCCSTPTGVCVPAAAGVQDSHSDRMFIATPPSGRLGAGLPMIPCVRALSVDSGEAGTCCRTRRCDRYDQAVYSSFSFPQEFYPLRKTAGFPPLRVDARKAFGAQSNATPPKVSVIYLLTQSFIC